MYEYELDEPTKPTKEELEVTETEEMTEDDSTEGTILQWLMTPELISVSKSKTADPPAEAFGQK